MNIVLFGPPGAGKGTQAERLQAAMHAPHISSGDIFRSMMVGDSALARELRSYLDRGDYVPDQLTNELVISRLHEPDARDGFLLDGFPRTIPQAEALDRALASANRKLDVALHVTAPRDVLVARIRGRIVCPHCHAIYNAVTKPPHHDMICDVCGHELQRRTDETYEAVQIRLDTYTRQTQPLIDFYGRKGILAEIDGARPLEMVDSEVDAAIGLKGVR